MGALGFPSDALEAFADVRAVAVQERRDLRPVDRHRDRP